MTAQVSQFIRGVISAVNRYTIVVVAGIALLISTTASAQTVKRVDATNGLTLAQGATGDDWSHAYKYLRDVLPSGNQGSSFEIWIAAGTYRPDEDSSNPTGDGTRSKTFTLRDNVKLYGGFLGLSHPSLPTTGETDKNQRDPYLNVTILSGDLDNDDDPDDPFDPTLIDDNSYHVVTIYGDSGTHIDGFVIRSGNAIDAPFPGYPSGFSGNPDSVPGGTGSGTGGGILTLSRNNAVDAFAAMPRILRCTFEYNAADLGGAAFFHGPQHGFATRLFNCTFRNNQATDDGAAIYNYGMSLAQLEPEPPAPCLTYSTVDIYNSLFHHNEAASEGGAYWGDHTSSLRIVNSTITANSTGIFQDFEDPCGNFEVHNSIVEW